MIKPIKTPTDLKNAKARISDLIKSNHLSLYDDEIEVLAALIEHFERNNVQMDAASPIAAIKFRMDQMGLSPRQVEPFIGSRARVSEVLSGKRQLSIDMIRSLHEGLGIPYESLISGRTADSSVESVPAPAIDKLNELGFDIDQEDVPALLKTLGYSNASAALHRKTLTQRAASKMDQTALLLWQAAVLRRSEKQSVVKRFDAPAFDSKALRKIARLSRSPDGPARAVSAFAEYGISVVVLPQLPGTFLDGAAMVAPTGTPVIGLTLRHDRTDNFWFTLLHEGAHVSLHYDLLHSNGAMFVDDMDIQNESELESQADELARESLIPSQLFSHIRWDNSTTQDDIVALSVRARVHPSIVAGRWQRDHQNYKKFSRLVERGTLRAQLGRDQ